MYSNLYQWRRIRNRVLVSGESKRRVAKDEGMSINTLRKILAIQKPPGYRPKRSVDHEISNVRPTARRTHLPAAKQRWMEWLYSLERGDAIAEATPALGGLIRRLSHPPNDPRKKILTVLAHDQGFSASAIERHLGVSRKTVVSYLKMFEAGGEDRLFDRKRKTRKADDESFKQALFSLLHEPPTLSGHNRTTWRMEDLHATLSDRGHPASDSVIREAIVKAGFKWRSAKVVLTSNDPDYREKLERVQTILSGLGSDERFFSIDEFGPFAINAKPGRVFAEPRFIPTVPQWQKSKGWLIATAALELSGNQVTHFYSKAKNTAEMIRMVETLLEEYQDAARLYISWDAASWHMSKKLLAFVDEHNGDARALPKVELVPLPASAQFLNVIESVFSGMARAIIHSSDYPSVKAATEAIDRYFEERNRHYRANPKRAGKKIWGMERTEAVFESSNNCKDPAYR
jgi:transposase